MLICDRCRNPLVRPHDFDVTFKSKAPNSSDWESTFKGIESVRLNLCTNCTGEVVHEVSKMLQAFRTYQSYLGIEEEDKRNGCSTLKAL